jgi:hypothetical protein
MHFNGAAAVMQYFDHFHSISLYSKDEGEDSQKIHFISLFISSLSPISFQFTAHDCVSPEWSGRRKSSAHSKPNHSIACKGSYRGESRVQVGQGNPATCIPAQSQFTHFTCDIHSIHASSSIKVPYKLVQFIVLTSKL